MDMRTSVYVYVQGVGGEDGEQRVIIDQGQLVCLHQQKIVSKIKFAKFFYQIILSPFSDRKIFHI